MAICLISLIGCSPVLHVGAGFGYVRDIPASHLTGHEQFHLKAEIEQPITDNLSLYGGWNHISNGAQIGIGKRPNQGLDIIGARVEAEFHLW
jgi:hypothetical protein